MPYIVKEYREKIDAEVNSLAAKISKVYKESPTQTRDGLLNYAFTVILRDVYRNPKYHDYNEMIGVLECCKQEFYRKMVAPYEDEKEKLNGPV